MTFPALLLLHRYGLSNCLFAATYDKILEECRCVPYFHTMAYEHYPVICSGVELTCMNAILRDIGSHTHVRVEEGGRNVTKPCLFACKDQGSGSHGAASGSRIRLKAQPEGVNLGFSILPAKVRGI